MKWSDGLVEDHRTIVEILQEANKLIEHPDNWCQGYLYQRGDGSLSTYASDPEICKYCSLGAINKIVPHGIMGVIATRRKAINYLERAISLRTKVSYMIDITAFNDANCHDEVMRMWNDAIQIAKEEHESNIQ